MPCCPVNNVLRSTVLIVFSDAVKMFEDQSHCAVELAAKNPIEAQLIARHNDKLIPVLVRGEAMSTESFLKTSQSSFTTAVNYLQVWGKHTNHLKISF